MRTVLRYLGGAVLVAVLIVGGVVLRVIQVGHVDQRAAADAIVVLGAAQYDGDPSPVFQARLDHAAELYREGVAPAHRDDRWWSVRGSHHRGCRRCGLPHGPGYRPAALIAVGSGDDTLESLRAADTMLTDNGWTSVVLVTDPWHAARAALMATDLGLSVQVSPVDGARRCGPASRRGTSSGRPSGVLYYRLTGGSSGVGSTVI